MVDGMVPAARLGGLAEPQNSVFDQKCLRRDDYIDMVGLDCHPVLDLDDRHLRVSAEQLGEQVFSCRLEMLNNHERHTAIGRHRLQKFSRDLEPSGRHADTDDWERPAVALIGIRIVWIGCGRTLVARPPAFLRRCL
jgi:hypothetical protein